MITGDKIAADLARQEKRGWPADELAILRWYRSHCTTASQWQAFTGVSWYRGPNGDWPTLGASRQWTVTPALRALAKGMA